jgi:maltose O-acetyltransferase
MASLDKRHRKSVLFPPWAWAVNGLAASPMLSPENRVRLYRKLGLDIQAYRVFPACYFHTAEVSVGRNATINYGCYFENVAHISIGRRAGLAPFVRILTSDHSVGPHKVRHGEWEPKPVTIGDGTWLGAGSLILPGVTVGDGCIVGAGAVVLDDCEDDGLYVGVPARRVKDLPLDAPPVARAQSED